MDDTGGRDETAGEPLPRRSRQHHLEPQLRERGGSGDGTPFAAFTDGEPPADEDSEATESGAVAFRRGTGRGRGEGQASR